MPGYIVTEADLNARGLSFYVVEGAQRVAHYGSLTLSGPFDRRGSVVLDTALCEFCDTPTDATGFCLSCDEFGGGCHGG